MLYNVSFVCMRDIVMLCLLCVYFCVNAAYSFIIFHLSVFFFVYIASQRLMNCILLVFLMLLSLDR